MRNDHTSLVHDDREQAALHDLPRDRRHVRRQHVEHVERVHARSRRVLALCPGRKPPFWAAKRPARAYKSAIQN